MTLAKYLFTAEKIATPKLKLDDQNKVLPPSVQSCFTSSPCSSNHPDISGTLVAIGVKKELLDATLRFSFSVTTTMEEVDYAADCVEALLPQLRRFFRK